MTTGISNVCKNIVSVDSFFWFSFEIIWSNGRAKVALQVLVKCSTLQLIHKHKIYPTDYLLQAYLAILNNKKNNKCFSCLIAGGRTKKPFQIFITNDKQARSKTTFLSAHLPVFWLNEQFSCDQTSIAWWIREIVKKWAVDTFSQQIFQISTFRKRSSVIFCSLNEAQTAQINLSNSEFRFTDLDINFTSRWFYYHDVELIGQYHRTIHWDLILLRPLLITKISLWK